VCENRVLRRIFGTEREEVVGGWRRLRNLNASSDIRVIKSSRIRWVENVARMGKMRNILTKFRRKISERKRK